MIHIAVVEDEKMYSDQLNGYLERYGKESGREIKVTFFTDGDEIIQHYKGEYDIILMDIQMKFMDGMAAAEKIREMDTKVIIIFITNMVQYAIRGYEVDALDYIVKPVEYFSFSQKLAKAIERIKPDDHRYISVTTDNGLKKIDIDEILYVESFGHYLKYETQKGVYQTRSTMKNAEEILEAYGFCRIHKGYLVNIKYVEEVRGSNCILGVKQIPISRVNRKNFMEKLTNYIGGGI
ncbi:LytTR family DNA-binding domain-containing protein [Lachnospiraceae bacterium OttesenSCG-928-D06]|nr:LytTR family DNA-binding domain-containing protein [Lachnospiraceae bacterium OttesenSCG-928-D06]